MECFSCERNLSAYIDDELTNETRVEIDSHLASCDACRKEYETHLAAWETAQRIPGESAPDGLWSAIESQIETRSAGTSTEDLALIVRGLAEEVRDLKHTVQMLRRDLEIVQRPEPEEERAGFPVHQRLRVWRETPGRTEAAS
jgi:hypothetical protein